MLQEEVMLWVFNSFHLLVLPAEIATGHMHTLIPSLNRANVSPQQLPAAVQPVI